MINYKFELNQQDTFALCDAFLAAELASFSSPSSETPRATYLRSLYRRICFAWKRDWTNPETAYLFDFSLTRLEADLFITVLSIHDMRLLPQVKEDAGTTGDTPQC